MFAFAAYPRVHPAMVVSLRRKSVAGREVRRDYNFRTLLQMEKDAGHDRLGASADRH
jgi:hypothetical protein